MREEDHTDRPPTTSPHASFSILSPYHHHHRRRRFLFLFPLLSLLSLQRIDPRAISMMRPAAPAAAACWTDGESVGVNEKESIALPLSLFLLSRPYPLTHMQENNWQSADSRQNYASTL